MNDEIFLKQLEQVIPPEASVQRIYVPTTHHELPATLHARTWASEHTQHIVWDLPDEPRFHVSRGGQRGDWNWVRPAAANLTFLALFILTLVFWPHSHSQPSAFTPSGLPPPAAQNTTATSSIPSRTTALDWQPIARSRADFSPATSHAYPAIRTRPSLYASDSITRSAFPRTATPYRLAGFQPGYRVAPAAPIAGNVPSLQSPY